MPKKMKRPVKKQAKKLLKKPIKKTVTKPMKKVAVKKTVVKVVKMVKPAKKIQKPLVKAVVRPLVEQPVQKAFVQTPVAKPQGAQKAAYKVGSYVVYPTHGVGRIMAEETQMIGDIALKMLVIVFEKDKMTLRVPVHRAPAAGLRLVSSSDQMKKVFITLKAKARISRGMWSRRAQEYEAKINSGNITLIAEVVRDLHQNVDQSERSYSERMIYESALSRLAGELAAAEGSDHKTATDKLMKLLRAKVAAAQAAQAQEAA